MRWRLVDWPQWGWGALIGTPQLLDRGFGCDQAVHQDSQHVIELAQELILKRQPNFEIHHALDQFYRRSCRHIVKGVPHHVSKICRAAQTASLLLMLAIAGSLAMACGDNITPLPEGLTELEPNQASPGPLGQIQFVDGEDDYLWLHGRASLAGDVAVVWAGLQVAERVVAICSINRYRITPIADALYDFSFTSDNEVDNVLTVDWQETWRFGTLRDDAVESQRRIRYQKTEGSSFISLIEGEIELTTEPGSGVVEISLIEHLKAIGGGISDMKQSMQRRFDIMAALAQGAPLPLCP